MPRRRDCDIHGCGVDGEIAGKARGHTVRERRRLFDFHGIHAHGLEGRADARVEAQELGHAGGRAFRPDDEPPCGDGRHDLVEDARRLALVRAAQRDLQEVGDVPDQLLLDGELVDRALDAAFEFAEPFLPGHEIGAARLEHEPAVRGEALCQQVIERGLADAMLARDQQRTDRFLARRRLGAGQGFLPAFGLDRVFQFPLVAPEAAEGRQEGLVDRTQLMLLQPLAQDFRRRMLDAVEDGDDVVVLGQRDLSDAGAERDLIAELSGACEVFLEQDRDQRVVGPPVARAQKRCADGRTRGQRLQIFEPEEDGEGHEPVEVRHDLVACGLAVATALQRSEAHAGERPARPDRIGDDGIERHRGIGEQVDGFVELGVLEEIAGVGQVLHDALELALQFAELAGDGACRRSVLRGLGLD